MASAWSQLDQLLTCAICLDRYRNPKLLPCQHTFCMEPCLDGLIDYARRQIKCPECRAEHRIPYKGIQEYPTNVTLMRFLELHRDITGEEPEPPPSMMERCGVCSEKANLEKCAHCDKKICPDCKEAHIDILRREINRINNQVRRGLHRLADALSQTKKNAEKLQQNCSQVKDEIEDIVRRYAKDLKHTEEKLKMDLQMYTETEIKAISKLKEDLEAEVSNMSSNCDLVDKHIKDDEEWSDAELLEYKDIFIKMLDFLRSFDADTTDYSRKIKFQPRADPDVLHRNIADFGELKINAPPSSSISQQSLAPPSSNALMRSQSDHRLAAQFARRTEGRSFADRYGGSDSERDPGRPTSPLYGRGRRETDSSSGYRRYTRDYDSDRSNRYTREENVSSSILSSRWRDSDEYGHRSSRYPRDYEDYDSEPQQQHSRSVRFADDPQPRERMFDVDEATKGPLSGVIRLMDSPKLMERLHQNEVRQKQQQTEKEKIQSQVETPPIVETRAPVAPQAPPRKTPVRQASEDDIDRQKKANQANSSTSSNTQSVPSTQDALSRSTSHKPSTETTKTQTQVPVRAQRKELVENSAPTTAEISNSIERQETRVRKQPSIAETVEEPEITTPSITRQVETEPKPKLDYNVDLSPKSPPLSPVGNSDEGEVLTQNQGDNTTCDNDSNTPRRQLAYTRHRSDTRYDRPTSRLGLVYQNPHSIPEEKPNSPTMTTSVLLSRYRPLRRSMEDYRGQERPNYNRFRDTALSRTPSIGDITFSRSPDLPIGDRRSPTASRYSPLYHHRTTHFPVLESSNDGNCSSDSCRTCLSQCSSCSSLGDYFDADSQISSESDIYEYNMRSKPALGKTVISDGRGSTTTQQQPELTAANTSDTKPTSIATSHPSLLALRSKRHENEENNRKEEVPIPAQSSFFSRQRRLPDPEPRLLENQTSEEDDDEDDDDVDEDDDDDEEEDETEDEDDVKLPSADLKLQQSANKSSTEETVEESESEESSTESSTTESESEDSDAVEDDNRGNGVQGSSHDADNKTTTTTYRSPSPKYESPLDDDEDDDDDCEVEDAIDYCSQNQTLSNDKKLPSASIDTNASRTRFRRRSDDLDTADSSSGSSSSTNYKSFSNTPTILSNGNVENNSVDSENNSSNSSHRRESRFANVRKRPTLARSKSSHELGLGYEDKEEVDDDDEVLEDSNVTPKYRSRSDKSSEDNIIHQRPCRKYGSLSSDNHSSMESATGLSPTSSSWATYLKNKYSGNGTGRVVPRSRSSHSLYQKTDSESSDDEPSSSVLGGSMSFPNARSTYMQKRRMLFKIGSRGTEPGNFTWPRGIAVGPEDSIVVADSSNHRVQVFDVEGHFSFEFGSYGSSEGQFDCLSGVSVNRIGQFIVSDRYNHRVQLFDPSGRFLRAFGSEGHTDGRFNYPWGITTDSLGFIYVCDKDNHRVQVFQSDGTFVGKFGCLGSRPGQLEHPHYIAVSNTNRVVVSDSNNHRVQIYDVNGRTLSTFGSEGSGEGQFKFPRGVAVDDQGFIIVGDSGNNRIQIFHPDGTFLRGFGTWGSGEGEFKGLEGIAVASSGNILVCDRENHRIQVF